MAFVKRHVSRQRRLAGSVRSVVDGLGNTATAVASGLASSRVKGVPRSAQDCAMARYLQAVIGGEPGVVRVLVFGDNIRVVRAGIRPTIVLPVPRAISAFVRGFDAGCFPDLVDSSRRPPSGQSAPVGEP